MKNTNIFIVLALVLSSQWSVVAAEPSTTKANHYIGFSAEVGEWSLLPKNEDTKLTFGAAGGLGFAYELQYGKTYSPTRLLVNVGLGAKGGYTVISPASSADTIEGNASSLRRRFADDETGTSQNNYYSNVMLRVPILVGMQYKKFYFLAGGKLDVSLYETEQPFKIDTLLFNVSFEIGGRFGNVIYETGYGVPQRTREYRLAVFADYGFGVMDINNNSGNLLVGLKFTVLFQMKEKKKSVVSYDSYLKSSPATSKAGHTLIDEDGYSGSSLRSTSGGGVKYEE